MMSVRTSRHVAAWLLHGHCMLQSSVVTRGINFGQRRSASPRSDSRTWQRSHRGASPPCHPASLAAA